MGSDDHSRRRPRLSALQRLFVRLCAGCMVVLSAAFVYERWDPIVVSNVVFRSTKVLDLVFTPGTHDPALPLIERYLDGKWAEITGNRERFALWDYFDLRETLAAAERRPRKWSEVVVARMELWARKLDASGDRRFTIEKDKCVMLEMLATLKLPHPRVRRTWKADEYDGGALKEYLLGAAYPAILKVGHIHQQKSTLFLPDAAAVHRDADRFVSWARNSRAPRERPPSRGRASLLPRCRRRWRPSSTTGRRCGPSRRTSSTTARRRA